MQGSARCAPINDLPVLGQKYNDFVIVGAGKTAIDAVLFLLKNDVKPQKISWIMPRDSWILDRAQIQPTLESIGMALANQIIPGSQSDDIDDFFDKISKAGGLLRIDDNVKPSMYRCSTVTKAELDQLKRVKNIVRKGRVKSISDTEIVLEHGSIATNLETLHVDCAGDGLAKRPPVPIFNERKITLQSVRTCQQVFSAALLGYVEANYKDDAKKNELCKPVPHPNTDIDFLRNNVADAINQENWAKEPGLKNWHQTSRLNFESHVINASPLIKILSTLSRLPLLRRFNTADKAQQKATENVRRLLDLHTTR